MNTKQVVKQYKKHGSVRLTAEAIGLQPSQVRNHLKKHAEQTGQDVNQFHTPSQTAKINEYLPQTFNNVRQLLNNETMSGVALCEIDGIIKAVSANKATGNLIGVYEKGSSSEYMRDDLYWYITNVMETDNAQTTG